MYCIIDIETNGLNHSRGKITEIAIFKHDGKQVIDEYQTLINPEGPIPYDIQRLTGISNQMVESAPRFYEVAKEILEFTEDSIFVAHNVGFDYGFVQKEFKDLGYTFSRKKICTVKQSKLLLPGHRSYSLGKLCKELNIPIEARHRAWGDAKATVKLFEILLETDSELGLGKDKKEQLSKYLHPDLNLDKVLDAPKKTGIYYLHNDKGDVIYVGKSINIRTRLYNHLRQPKTQKAIRMHTEVADVSYEITGSELAALLIESDQIKRIQPKYNVALKRSNFPFGVRIEQDLFGYKHLLIEKINPQREYLTAFTTQAGAKKRLEYLCEEYGLCRGLAGLSKCSNGCVSYGVGQCLGAALNEENSDDYNIRIEQAVKTLNPINTSCLIIDKGPDQDTLWAFKLERNHFAGLGTFDPLYSDAKDQILDCIKPIGDNPDSRHIIASYLTRKRVKNIIDLNSEHN